MEKGGVWALGGDGGEGLFGETRGWVFVGLDYYPTVPIHLYLFRIRHKVLLQLELNLPLIFHQKRLIPAFFKKVLYQIKLIVVIND